MAKATTAGANMLLIKSNWSERRSFRMIPIADDCPYTEALYDPDNKVLVLISKITKNTMHMLPKLDDNGDPQILSKPRPQSVKNYREERKSLETFQEYYVTDKEDAETIIKMFAVNHASFPYAETLSAPPVPPPGSQIVVPEEKKIILP